VSQFSLIFSLIDAFYEEGRKRRGRNRKKNEAKESKKQNRLLINGFRSKAAAYRV